MLKFLFTHEPELNHSRELAHYNSVNEFIQTRLSLLNSIDSLSNELKQYKNKNSYLMVIYNVDINNDYRNVIKIFKIAYTIYVFEFINKEKYKQFKQCLTELDNLEEENNLSIPQLKII